MPAAILSLLVLFTLVTARAETPDAAFDAANKLYAEGKYAAAATAFEKLGQEGQSSAALFFNLGNAYFKSGQIGRAIAAYRCAEQIAPRDPDIRANLRFARNQIVGPTQPPTRSQQWLTQLTLNEWTAAAASFGWVWLILLTIPQWKPALKPALRNYALSAGLLTLLFALGTGLAYAEHRPGSLAIVTVGEAAIHNAPLDESPTPFSLHNGAELRVLDQKDDWLQVTTDPTRIGWLRRNQVLFGR
jgi:tetratricopeptide (TPR) repeat protein